MGKKIPRKRMGKMKGPRESRNSKRVRKLAGRGVKHFYHKLHTLKVAMKYISRKLSAVEMAKKGNV